MHELIGKIFGILSSICFGYAAGQLIIWLTKKERAE